MSKVITTRYSAVAAVGILLAILTIVPFSPGAAADSVTPIPAAPTATPTIAPTYTPQIGVPPPDPTFTAPRALGPRTRYYAEYPKMVAERDGSLSIIWIWGERDHLFYIHSTDAGASWSNPTTIAGNPLWGGSVGNTSIESDDQGQLHITAYELYGSTYPHVSYIRRDASGQWQPTLIVPNSIDGRMKVAALGVDEAQGQALVMAGRSATSLGLYSTDGHTWTGSAGLPLTDASLPNPVWLPAVAVSKDGALLVVWGDHRLGAFNLMSATTRADRAEVGDVSWSTYTFTDTFPNGQAATGDRQYTVSLQPLADGSIAAVYEGRDPDSDTKDIYYREWNPKKYGSLHGGWQTYPVRLSTAPIPSEAPNICVDGRGQRYVFWQDYWSNLRVVYTYSSDGITWHAIQRVNGGPFQREKHPSCAVVGNNLFVAWDDRLRNQDDNFAPAYIYFASRALPDLYPLPPTPTPTLSPAPTAQP